MREFSTEILGSTWTVLFRTEAEDARLKEVGGFTDWTTREIVIADVRSDYNVRAVEESMYHVLRHELVHAFLFESGLGYDWEHSDLGQDETTVDWTAWQLPKIWETYLLAKEQLKAVLAE